MTRAEFEHAFVVASDLGTIERLHDMGLRAYPCDCGEPACHGWKLLHERAVKRHPELVAMLVEIRDGEELK